MEDRGRASREWEGRFRLGAGIAGGPGVEDLLEVFQWILYSPGSARP